jgi:class 3 adenylate cyclase
MVVVGQNTLKAIEGQFDCHFFGEVALKGKEKKVGAYQVLSELRLGGQGRDTAPSPAASPPEV